MKEITIRDLQSWCKAHGEYAQFHPDGSIFVSTADSSSDVRHNTETLSETISSWLDDQRMDVIGQNGPTGEHYPRADVLPGYECLADVLERALDQAQRGKGHERHAQGLPFNQQPMQQLIGLYGVGFALGQAGKKAQESQRLEHGAAVRELLGAINYLAGAVIAMEGQRHG